MFIVGVAAFVIAAVWTQPMKIRQSFFLLAIMTVPALADDDYTTPSSSGGDAGLFLFWIFGSLICGMIGAAIGKQKGTAVGGALLGFLLGPLGIILVAVSKGSRINCPTCQELINPLAKVCPKCHSTLTMNGENSLSFEVWKAQLFAKDSAYREQSRAWLESHYREEMQYLGTKKEPASVTKPTPPNVTKALRFYIFKPGDDDAQGPFDMSQIEALQTCGVVTMDTQYCREGENEWRTTAS